MPEITLTIRSRMENLGLAGAAARAVAAVHLGGATASLVEIAVTEVCSNVIRHGHPDDPDHEFTVALRVIERGLEVEIRDVGRPFSFVRPPMPSVDVPLDQLPEGGFGMALVHETMEVVEYRRTGNVNIVRLVKRAEAEGRRNP